MVITATCVIIIIIIIIRVTFAKAPARLVRGGWI
jgi:hypothetical protein